MCVCTDLQEDASYSTEQLYSLLGLILDDGVVGLHSQNVVLETRFKGENKVTKTNKQTKDNELTAGEGIAEVWRGQSKVREITGSVVSERARGQSSNIFPLFLSTGALQTCMCVFVRVCLQRVRLSKVQEVSDFYRSPVVFSNNETNSY